MDVAALTDIPQQVSTGALPGWDRVDELVREAHRRYADDRTGAVADYIPVLAEADPELFGLAVIEVDGGLHDAGDALHPFSIQSISKMFVYALAIQEHGHERVREIVGVNNTGLAFNSLMALELNAGHPMNPMVNAGAIATTALMPGQTSVEQWERVREGLSAFAGRPLSLDGVVYASEAETNERNRAMGWLLRSYGRLTGDPDDVVDVYTRQCALSVTAHDLAVMGATLADGGVNPITGERVVSADVCRDTLAVVASTGLYETSGEWLFEIGLPAKSGVAGGIVAVAPGKGAVAGFSPRLDRAGNSVRSQLAIGHLSRALGLNLFASAPSATPRSTD
ncbi:glutaminase [Microbacterium foliorum]|uniref:Glutaminase n=1 Tax=Microbacterium foliorum TaxID=104336 RepID=A0ABU1HLN3_9MICO|nr:MULTISPECIES: glutaminase A [Microbacterium]AQY01066.1 glutaminase [Microbacterium foliorum]KIP88443.1 glutaminase [Microbacterium sp. MEJ108Y]KQR49470.1 glutaminase A [Microbacterium sp. Leaf161]MDR6140949.1 glutaminase [Microbacterium foliorum]